MFMAENVSCSNNRRRPEGRLKPLNAYKPTDFRRMIIAKKMKSLREYSLSTKRSISVKPKEFVARCALSVGTQNAGSNIDALRLAIHDLGFNEVADDQDRDITWNGAYFYKHDRKRRGFINKFPGVHCLLTKIGLFGCLEFQRKLYPDAYDFYPPTWFLPYHYDKWAAYVASQVPGCVTYIVKPSGGTQGKGIFLVQSPREYCEHQVQVALEAPVKPRKNVSQNKSNQQYWQQASNEATRLCADNFGFLPAREVVQRYEERPALVSGYKADLRIYVVLESIAPLRIHIYRDGLVRLASQRYQPPDPVNMHKSKMHLTNYSINKFPDTEELEENMNSSDDTGSEEAGSDTIAQTPTTPGPTNIGGANSHPDIWQCKRRLRNFFCRSSLNLPAGHKVSRKSSIGQHWRLEPKSFWSKVDDLVRNTMFALIPHLRVAYWAECLQSFQSRSDLAETGGDKKGPHCFQIFGFDLLLVEPDFRPLLLEVNSSPSLRIDCMRPLVSYRCCKDGLSPSIVNSSRYAAFSRSHVDEIVKAGLLRATLSLIGSRLLFERMQSDSPKKAFAFLTACGYKTASNATEDSKDNVSVVNQTDKNKTTTNCLVGNQPLPQLSRRILFDESKFCRRGGVPVRLGSYWMSDQISQFYDTQVKSKAVKDNSSTIEANIDELARKVSNPWPPFRRRTLSSIYGRQKVNERLTNFFLDRRRSDSLRISRNLLHCIYAEDNVYFPCAPQADSEDASDSEDNDVPSTEVNHEDVEQVLAGEAPDSRVHDFDDLESPSEVNKKSFSLQSQQLLRDGKRSSKDSEVKKCKASFAQLRQVDRLADIFMTILTDRRATEQKKNHNQQQLRPHQQYNSHQPPRTHVHGSFMNVFPYVVHTDSLDHAVPSNQSQRYECNLNSVEVVIPRMDNSAFRSFIQRCQLRNLCPNTYELDLVYMKHRMHWSRVYEPDILESENGISFPAFVDLCLRLARKYFWPSSQNSHLKMVNEDVGSLSSAELLRMAMTSFIDHCVESLRGHPLRVRPSIRSPVEWKSNCKSNNCSPNRYHRAI